MKNYLMLGSVFLFASFAWGGTVQCSPSPNAPVAAGDALAPGLPIIFSCPGFGVAADGLNITQLAVITSASWSVTNGIRNTHYGMIVGGILAISSQFWVPGYSVPLADFTNGLGLAAGIGSETMLAVSGLPLDYVLPFVVRVDAYNIPGLGFPTSATAAVMVEYVESAPLTQAPEPSALILVSLGVLAVPFSRWKAARKNAGGLGVDNAPG